MKWNLDLIKNNQKNKFFSSFHNILPIILFFFLFFFFLIINFKTPLYGEDFALSIPLSKQGLSFFDKTNVIIQKIISQSVNWNSRLGEQLAIIFASGNNNLFNILNSFLTFLYFGLIIIISNGKIIKISLENIFYISITALLFIQIPKFGEIFFWLTGSSNYLWSSFLLLLVFLPYRYLFSGIDYFSNKSKIIKILFLLLSFFGGMTNENSVFSIIIMIIFSFIWIRKRKNQLIKINWYRCNFVFLLIGYILLLTSSSTKIRRNYYLEQINIDFSNFYVILNRILSIMLNFFKNSYFLLILVIIVVIFLLILKQKYNWDLSEISKERIFISSMLLLLSLTSIPPLFFTYFESRSLLVSWVFLIILFISLYQEIFSYNPIFGLLLILPIIVLGFVKIQNVYDCYSKFNTLAVNRHITILSNINSGNQIIKVDRIPDFCPNFFDNREDWIIHFKHDEVYYGVNTIEILN